MSTTQPHWWRGARGEWYVVAQVALIALVFLGPRTMAVLPQWPFVRFWSLLGGAMMFAGISLLLAGLFSLRSSLTPLPYPRAGGKLIQTGPYGLVRHPMYAGGVVLAYGWALFAHGWLTLVYATVLFIFVDIKSAREERWLTEKFPEYGEYQHRIRKLIPFVY